MSRECSHVATLAVARTFFPCSRCHAGKALWHDQATYGHRTNSHDRVAVAAAASAATPDHLTIAKRQKGPHDSRATRAYE